MESLRECRERLNLTLQAVADALGVTRQAVYRWEHGDCSPKGDVFDRLRELYGITKSKKHYRLLGRKENSGAFEKVQIPTRGRPRKYAFSNKEIFSKYGGLCAYCGCTISVKTMEIDVISGAKELQERQAARKDIEKVNPVCSTCKASKGSKSLQMWRESESNKVFYFEKEN